MRRALLSLAATLFALVGLAIFAIPAFAHAQLESTDPNNGAVLTHAPQNVTLHFGESVEIPLGSLEVYDTNQHRVDRGTPHHPNGDTHSVTVDVNHLGNGGYVATWRVISADSHPVHGAFTFQVGTTTVNTDSLAQRLLTQGRGNTSVGVAYGIVRAAVVGSLILLIGSIAFALLIAKDAWTRSRFRATTWIALILLAIATLVGYALQGVYAAGMPLSRITDTTNITDLANTRFGITTIIRLVLLAVFAILLKWGGLVITHWRRVVFCGLAVALTLTLTLAGHAGTGRWIPLAVVLDALHVLSASAWTGGLIILVVLWHSESSESITSLVAGFSRVALIAVSILVATGSLQGYRQLGSINALIHTDYGRLLLIKVAIVALMVLFGWRARSLLNNAQHVLRSVRIEASLAVAVFIVTALLMNSAPGLTAISKPYSGEVAIGTHLVDVIDEPAKPGVNVIHLYVLTNEGAPTDVPDLTATLTLNSHDIGPVPIPLTRLAPGHFATLGFTIPISGTWEMDISVRTSDIDVSTGALHIPIK